MTVRLSFHGAARTVTGSCYLLETSQSRVLIDCGMFQGSRTESELNRRPFAFSPEALTAMLLTHAHIDHTGLIPKLVRDGFTGSIHCTTATFDLCTVMLPDSAFIQESEARLKTERNLRRGLPEVEPLYTTQDALQALERFSPLNYKDWVPVAAGVKARWWNAGHLLGSASIEVETEQENGSRPLRLLFSGDIGPDIKMFEPDPEAPSGFDYVICESTYGDKDRFERSQDKRRQLLAAELNAAASRKGVLLIPSFAVERTQEVVTDVMALMEQGQVPKAQIFIDSPLANKATAVFRKHAKELEQGDALARAFQSPLVHSTETVDDSKALNKLSGFHIIIAASGMAEAGRIRHHLKNHLWKPSTTVLLVGFQAAGTLGQVLESGAEVVRIMGEEVQVRADIRRIDDYSGHADGPELMQWMRERLPVAGGVFLTHGEEDPQLALEKKLTTLMPQSLIHRPALDDVFELTEKGARQLFETKPRLDPARVARPDWNNDAANLHLDIDQELRKASDDKSRAILIRRLRRALAGDGGPDQNASSQWRRPNRSGHARRSGRGYDSE